MTTITQKLADALRALYTLVPFDGNHADEMAKGKQLKEAREALAAYDAQQEQELTIRVCGEGARMALCDCLKGWTARRDGTWHVVTTRGNREHVLALINDLGIRATVKAVRHA